MGGMTERKYSRGCGLMAVLIYLLLGLAACLLLDSCRSQGRALMSGTASADSTWLRVLQAAARHDSTVYRERVEIVPRIVRAGDTTIVRMDTAVYRLTERTVYNQYNVYRDSGHARRDSVAVTYRYAGGGKTSAGGPGWRHIAGWLLLLMLAVLLAWLIKRGAE